MKVLTAAEMREVDRRTEEIGISNPILMENAGHRVVEFLAEKFSPLSSHRIVVICGKGNNGGDGFVIARQLFTRYRPQKLYVVTGAPEQDSAPLRMLRAVGCSVHDCITPEMRIATLVIDALLGTGLTGPARGKALNFIHQINHDFPLARVVAVDVPSGMDSDSGVSDGEIARADATVTFTAPKICHVLAPNCDRIGELRVGHIGSPDHLLKDVRLHVTEPAEFSRLLAPRETDTNKGTYGHVLVVGGSEGKSGAAEMTGLAALRAGAGLVTVASSAAKLGTLELMTAVLPEDFGLLRATAERKDVIAIGPGLGTSEQAQVLIREAVAESEQGMVIDADGLNVLAGHDWHVPAGKIRVLTPHPGEMARLLRRTVQDVQSDRIGCAREYARRCGATVVLKGYRTIIAFPDERVWVNPTGTPALATGGTGDILTGLIAGFIAQFPAQYERAVLAAVYLHGLAGKLAASVLGEKSLLATDLLTYLPEAIRECADV
jgi:NAD(P)H-hydrate epimerase